ncbi:MAG: sugar phosphate isomerase/epimerase [Pirellulaceae bacterium]|nr:sugar phosphate isomerase/epimerase [Planctomycetales bacterium]
MFVAASTDCFPELPLRDALGKLVDLEYTGVEIAMRENGVQLAPSQVAQDVDATIDICRDTYRLDVVAYAAYIEAQGEEYFSQFEAICKLAKATKVVTIAIPSGELGTPFNEEVEKLRRLVAIAERQGARVAMMTHIGCLAEDPDTITVLCDNVKGLGITLDPSHFIAGPHRKKNYEKLMKYVYHVHLRDTSKDRLQVRVGQGEVEYGRLVTLLEQVRYDRALCVHIPPMEEVDHYGELRKMRLLLESLL